MEPKTRKSTTSKADSVSNSPKSSGRMSAEDKLKKSIKNLSYTSGGAGSMDLNSTKSSSKSSTSTSSSRKKVGGVVLDVETIQDATKQKFETRGKRNNVIILVLSLLLVVSLVYLAVAVANYYKGKREPNFKYEVQGNVKAEWIIEGKKQTEFHVHNDIGPDMIYLLDSRLDIKTSAPVTLTVEIVVLVDDKEILIGGLDNPHENLLRVEGENKFSYQGAIVGGGTVNLFKGIDFSEAPGNLNSRNVKIQVIAHVNTL